MTWRDSPRALTTLPICSPRATSSRIPSQSAAMRARVSSLILVVITPVYQSCRARRLFREPAARRLFRACQGLSLNSRMRTRDTTRIHRYVSRLSRCMSLRDTRATRANKHRIIKAFFCRVRVASCRAPSYPQVRRCRVFVTIEL